VETVGSGLSTKNWGMPIGKQAGARGRWIPSGGNSRKGGPRQAWEQGQQLYLIVREAREGGGFPVGQ